MDSGLAASRRPGMTLCLGHGIGDVDIDGRGVGVWSAREYLTRS